jgi:hypothetical protein
MTKERRVAGRNNKAASCVSSMMADDPDVVVGSEDSK